MSTRLTRSSSRVTRSSALHSDQSAPGTVTQTGDSNYLRGPGASQERNSPRVKRSAKPALAELRPDAVTESDTAPRVRGARKRDAAIAVGAAQEESVAEEAEQVDTGKAVKRKRRTTKAEAAVVEVAPLAARTEGLRMFVGAHISAAGGVQNSLNNARHIGANAWALFMKSQRKWDNPPMQDEHRDAFIRFCKELKYDQARHCLPHGSYLVNLAQEDHAKAKQAYDSFVDDLKRCEAVGIKLYNFHPGAAGKTTLESAITRLATALTKALDATTTVIPVLETMCGQGSVIGGELSQFRDIISQIPEKHHARLGICWDTCHSFAAGYDYRTKEGLDAFLNQFDETIGLKYLRALHMNDSKTPLGSHRDLHANIGTGFLGLRAFHHIMNEPRLEGLPLILETPLEKLDATTGKTADDLSIWADEIKLLESLIGMDLESKQFTTLEKSLSEKGKTERAKHQTQFDKKQEEAKRKEEKAKQRSLKDMFGKGNADK
ncbi:hypothetical protein KEM52_001919 [Ascosphaera acerosa]|nr:hypothetical protein KEM52_001919 [Ascosphaera acerosa]